MKKSVRLVAAIAVCIATLSTTNAHANNTPRTTIFGALGKTFYKLDADVRKIKTSFAIGGSYRFNQYLAVEARHDEFGEISSSQTRFGIYEEFSFSVSAMAISLKATLPLLSNALYAKAGLSFWEVDSRVRSSDFKNFSSYGSLHTSGNNFHFGFGREFNIADRLIMSIEYTQLGVGDIIDLTAHSFCVGIGYTL